MIDDDPVLFQFGGVEYMGASSGVNRRRPLEIGGFEDQPELSIAINLVNMEGDRVFGQDPPVVGSRITVNGIAYRVDRTEVDSFNECLQIDLKSKDK